MLAVWALTPRGRTVESLQTSGWLQGPRWRNAEPRRRPRGGEARVREDPAMRCAVPPVAGIPFLTPWDFHSIEGCDQGLGSKAVRGGSSPPTPTH